MQKISLDTKEKILAAAESVFHENGFKGARTTLIAERSGVSRTMMHYYFSTKEELFQEVLKQSFGFFLEKAVQLFNEPEDLKSMINKMVDLLHDALLEKPGLPSFMVNMLNEKPDLFTQIPLVQEEDLPRKFDRLLDEARTEGLIHSQIDGENLVLHIYGMICIPFLGNPLIQFKEGRSQEDMKLFLDARRDGIKTFIWNGLTNH